MKIITRNGNTFFSFIPELPGSCYGSFVKSDRSVLPQQDEPSEFGHLLCSRFDDGLQPKSALSHQHFRAHPDPQVLDRDLAQEPTSLINIYD